MFIRYFRYFLEGRELHVLTDNETMTHSRPDHHSPRKVIHLDFISQFFTDLCHVQGSMNAATDVFSQLEANALHTGHTSMVNFHELALAQNRRP